jgi:hypothetical protein
VLYISNSTSLLPFAASFLEAMTHSHGRRGARVEADAEHQIWRCPNLRGPTPAVYVGTAKVWAYVAVWVARGAS